MIRSTCRKLAESLDDHPITFESRRLIHRRSRVLALGSCFALRVKEWLLARDYTVLNEGDLRPWVVNGRAEFDPRIYYNTFCIRYEFERVAGQFVQQEDDVWEPHQTLQRVFQDPYRRMLIAADRQSLWLRIREVDVQMRKHIETADLVIITLGLTEVFFQQHNGRAICAAPGYSGGGGFGCEFRVTEYAENYENLRRTIDILAEVNPKAQVVLTVSPVPLGSTFAGVDHLVANTDSKSTLRAVAGALVRRYDHAHYFHSYELAMSAPRHEVFLEDGRHVSPQCVAKIMDDFERAFVTDARAGVVETGSKAAGSPLRRGPRFLEVRSPAAQAPRPGGCASAS
jgi:hypothetical protein